MTASYDDSRLLDNAQAEFLRLFSSSEPELFRYIVALVPNLADAEEILQQSAVALWAKFQQYDSSQPFTPWACRFAINVVKQWAASRQRWKSVAIDGLAEELTGRRSVLQPQFEDRLRNLDDCLRKLPAEQRAIVEAYYWKRSAVDVIAANAQKSVAAIYKLLQRSRALLRECIEQGAQSGDLLL